MGYLTTKNKRTLSKNENIKDKIAVVVTTVTMVHFFLVPHLNKLSEIYDVTLILKNDAPDLLLEMALPVSVLEIPIERKIKLLSDIKTLFKLILIFRREKFKAVHTITPKAGLLGTIASFLARIPIRIHTFQGEFWVNTTGLIRKFFIFLDKIVALLSTNIIVVSRSEREFLIKERILSVGQAKVLGAGTIGGIDLNRFSKKQKQRQLQRSKLGYLDNDVVFAYLGRLNADKGLSILTDAFDILFPNHPSSRLLIIGPDEDGTGKKLNDYSSQYSSGVVTVLSFMRNPETSLISADVLILPSFREGFGLVILEAAAMGIPAIGSNIYGISDAIQDGQTGQLFTVGDSFDLSIKMKNMVTQDDTRTKQGFCAYQRVVHSFSQENILGHFLEYYRSLKIEDC
jgi:glycosyltransferase involved in cell wall biosynthesis